MNAFQSHQGSRALDETQGVVASTLKLSRNGASLLANSFGVGFIVWLGIGVNNESRVVTAVDR